MLGFISRNRSDHPMADEKGAKEFLAELPTQDTFKTLQEIAFWLDTTRTSDGLKPQRIYEIIDQLDQAAKPHQRKLSQEYLAGGVRLPRVSGAAHLDGCGRVLAAVGRRLRVLSRPDSAGRVRAPEP